MSGHGFGLGNGRLGGRGSSPFTPKKIAGLAAWYRADMGITIGTGVSAWADQSGNGANATQGTGANQPTFAAADASFNGRPSLTSTSTQWLTGALAMPNPGTIFVVLRLTGAAILACSSNAAAIYVGGDGAGNVQVVSGVGGAKKALAINTTAAIVAEYGASGEMWVNAQTGGAVVNTGASTGTSVWLMNSSNQTQGGIVAAEFAFYNRALTQSEINSLLNYAGSRYGLTIGA